MQGTQIVELTSNKTGLFSLQMERIEPGDFRPEEIAGHVGSRISFDGVVRNHHENRQVLALEYDAYDALCDSEGQAIVEEILARYDINALYIIHRVGLVPIGERALWVEVHSAHRRDGFEACQQAIDEVKRRLPVWKYETYGDGQSQWVYCACH